jgi:hypothetical protein
MAGPSSDRQRYRLLSGWFDGSLDDAELERLDELLRTGPMAPSTSSGWCRRFGPWTTWK